MDSTTPRGAKDSGVRARILCLHGSRQDGELFSQRLRNLTRKLAGVADLHFASAPHELPLSEGQSVAMRTWWRHWNLPQQDPTVLDPDSDGMSAAHPDQQTRERGKAAAAAMAVTAASTAATTAPLPPDGWDEQIVRDWKASFQLLVAEWRRAGPFDGLLGFSNGAAAALLLACYAHADPASLPGLKFVILAGGYVPQPLERLIPTGMTTTTTTFPQKRSADRNSSNSASSSSSTPHDAIINRLAKELPYMSLHFCSAADVAVPYADSLELAACFQVGCRTILEHDLGHCLPQKAPHTAAVLDFVRQACSSSAPSCGGGGSSGGEGRSNAAGASRREARGEGGASGGRGGGGGRGGRGDARDPVAAALSGIVPPSSLAVSKGTGTGAAGAAVGQQHGLTSGGSSASSRQPHQQQRQQQQPPPRQPQEHPQPQQRQGGQLPSAPAPRAPLIVGGGGGMGSGTSSNRTSAPTTTATSPAAAATSRGGRSGRDGGGGGGSSGSNSSSCKPSAAAAAPAPSPKAPSSSSSPATASRNGAASGAAAAAATAAATSAAATPTAAATPATAGGAPGKGAPT
ncbi:hypothetical protein Agub_g3955, partial [Astrephomene gubernaculifera]